MGWADKLVLLVAAVAGLTACGGGDDPVPRLTSLGAELLHAAGVQPLPGRPDSGPVAVQVKDAPRYVVATGSIPQPQAVARSTIVTSMRRAGYGVARTSDDTVTAVKDDVVAELTLYAQLGEVQASPGTCIVQLRLGPRDPRLAWTRVP